MRHGLYVIGDSVSRTFGGLSSSENDLTAKRAFMMALSGPGIPSYILADVALYKVGDFVDDDFLNPVVIPCVPAVISRGSDPEVLDFVKKSIDFQRRVGMADDFDMDEPSGSEDSDFECEG